MKTNDGKIVYNPITQKWEKTYLTDEINREEIQKNRGNEDGLYNQSILRGYFESYDETNSTLTMKSIVPFTQNSLFEISQLRLNSVQDIYCAPERYVDPNNGKSFEVRNLTIPVKDGQALYIPTEKIINFETFISKSKDSTYILVQLTKNYDKESTNYAKKIIVIGLCE